jgi:phage terminase large subunit-like protein
LSERSVCAMNALTVPGQDERPWPTLGGQVCDFIEAYLTHGPGDLRGLPAKIDPEKRAFIYRAYEVFPPGHAQAGFRRFDRAVLSLLKGSAKTELAAWIAAAELDEEGPVRCDGFDAHGNPVGRPVTDPYIPMVAYTEEQSEDLAYGALLVILEHSKIVNRYDLGLDRIMRIKGDGIAKPLASAPSSRDGAKTTFQHFDETHRLTLPRLKQAHTTMLANIPKRMRADAWTLETTTAHAPGENSVAEDSFQYAEAVRGGQIKDPRLFYYHRQASERHDLATPEGRRDAFVEAAGPLVDRYNVPKVLSQWDAPKADVAYLERVWFNMPRQGGSRAFKLDVWRSRVRQGYVVQDGAWITLGFDGSRRLDATALVATEVVTGYQWPLCIIERPHAAPPDWLMPAAPFDQAVAEAFRHWNVWRFYADPPYWETVIDNWAGAYGEERVIRWFTNRLLKMAYAVRAFINAMTDAEVSAPIVVHPTAAESTAAAGELELVHHDLTHAGDLVVDRHIGNAHRLEVSAEDESGQKLYAIQKERSDSLNKIDGAVASVLSWEARRDALKAGIGKRDEGSVYDDRGLLWV